MTTANNASLPPTEHRLKTREYIGYAMGDTASNFFFQTFSIFLTYYYVDVWGIPNTVLLWMLPIIVLLDAVFDPAMGLIADRTNTRWGKFRPYILWGAIPYGICGYLMFAGPDWSTNGKIAYAFATYLLMYLSYSVINVPYSSLMGVLSPSSGTRAVASSFRFVGAFTGGFLVATFVRPLVKFLGELDATPAVKAAAATNKAVQGQLDTRGFQLTMAIFAVLSAVMFLTCFLTTKERVTPPRGQKSNAREELGELVRNFPWIMLLVASVFSTTFIALRAGSTIFFFKYVVGADKTPLFSVLGLNFDKATVFLSAAMLSQIAGTLLLGTVVRKLDKKNTAVILCTITGLTLMSFYFLPKDQYALLVAVNCIGYMAMGPTSALTWALYSDVADYGEWKFGRRSTGLVFSASLFSIKTGQVVGGFLLPLFLALFGFDKNANAQTDNAKWGILLAFSVAAGGFALLKAGALFVYPLDRKRVVQIETELTKRRAEAATAATAVGAESK
ncbi:MAG TPA: MFS transporter [Tepidisphaeraceae bacterium]|nr:MFS transporter [Tepidisphaeraceae bacterium]